MKLQEGPAFGALIIGTGVAFLIYKKTNNLTLALGGGAFVVNADYFLVILIKRVTHK